jgi:hypothetical protein
MLTIHTTVGSAASGGFFQKNTLSRKNTVGLVCYALLNPHFADSLADAGSDPPMLCR